MAIIWSDGYNFPLCQHCLDVCVKFVVATTIKRDPKIQEVPLMHVSRLYRAISDVIFYNQDSCSFQASISCKHFSDGALIKVGLCLLEYTTLAFLV